MHHAARVLEFSGVVSALASECETARGAQLATDLVPAFDRADVQTLLEETAEAYSLLGSSQIPGLSSFRDYIDELNRASKGGSMNGASLYGIGEVLSASRQFKSFMLSRSGDFPHFWKRAEAFVESRSLEHLLFMSLDGDGEVKDDASPALGALRARKKGALAKIHERIQAHLSRSRAILSDHVFTVRDGRYVIPVKADYRGRIKGVVHDTSASGQTLFIEPDDVLQAGNALREIEGQEQEEIRRILASLSSKVGAIGPDIQTTLEVGWHLDLLLAKARLAYRMKAGKPELRQSPGIALHGARHPLMVLSSSEIVPLDIDVGFATKALLITGPNTGGKTVALKTVGLSVLMAQSGLFVPALSCYLGPFSQIWADIGDEQSLQQNLSTFSAHIRNISEALKSLKPGALALFDEIGAGTDPAEGSALAKAILTFLVDNGATIVASTHYGDLKAFAYETENFVNAAMEFDVKTLKPTYKLLMGLPGASQAMRIAERYGIPKDIVNQANEYLGSEERDTASLILKLESAQRQARIAQGEADRRLNDANAAKKEAEKLLARAEEIRNRAQERAQEALQEALREIRLEAADLFDQLKGAPTTKQREEIRAQLKELDRRRAPKQSHPKPSAPQTSTALEKGQSVKVRGYSQVGTLLDTPKGGRVEVQLGSLKMKVPVEDVSVQTVAEKPSSQVSRMSLQRAATAKTELHLRAMRAEDAQHELERFLDDAVLGGLDKVRIVHGKGEGILRHMTHDFLKTYRAAKSYSLGEPEEGGAGVTVVQLK